MGSSNNKGQARAQPRSSSQLRRVSGSRWDRWRATIRDRWCRALELKTVWILLLLVAGTWSLVPRWAVPENAVQAGTVADRTWVADRDLVVVDELATEAVREAARAEVLPVYDFDKAQLAGLRRQLAALFESGRDRLGGLGETSADGAPDSFPAAETEESAAAAEAEEDLIASLRDLLATETSLQLDSEVLDILIEVGFSSGLEERISGLFSRILRQGVVADKELLLDEVEGILVRNLPSGETTKEKNLFRYLDFPEEVLTSVEQETRTWTDLDGPTRSLLTTFVVTNLQPNLTLNTSETRALEERAAQDSGVVSHSARKGEVIVRKRERIDEVEARLLRELHGQRNLREAMLRWLGTLLFLSGIMFLLWVALGTEGRTDRSRDRLLGEGLLLMTAQLLGIRFGLFLAEAIGNSMTREPFASVESYVFAVPFAALPLAAALLYGRRYALVLTLVASMAVGPTAGSERMWILTVFALAGSLAAVFAIDPVQFKERSMLSRAGLVVGGVNGVAIIALRALGGELASISQLGFDIVCGLVGGILAAATVSFTIPILESLLSITTHIKLIELANPNLPLLRRLAFEAPGTFQHSLAVANLAKSGCEAIDRDAVLVHTCALYHDIGKISRPRYFVENQVGGQNPHDKIQPTMSALILINHVKEGAELATSAGLPGVVIDGIEQHHGSRLIKFFYARAQERSDPETEEVREEEFRYPGPKPKNKEMGILMLADAVEAASRTLIDPSSQKLRGLVRKIIDDCLQDRQLDQTDLTLGDLRQVEEAFVRVLTRVYHKRVEYPGFDFNQPKGERRRRDDETGTGARRAG